MGPLGRSGTRSFIFSAASFDGAGLRSMRVGLSTAWRASATGPWAFSGAFLSGGFLQPASATAAQTSAANSTRFREIPLILIKSELSI
jgi:hypothetical protein